MLCLLLAGWVSPESSVYQSSRECMAFNGSPSYVVTGNTSKFDCQMP